MERPCAGAGGIFWGFLCGKNLKVLDVMKGTPAEKFGLKKG
eukprot:gene15412-34013_t